MLYNILNCGQNIQNQIKIHNKIYFDFAWVNSRRAAISFHLCLICVPLRCICGAPKRKYKIKCLQKTGTHAMLNLFLGRQSVEVGSSCCCENFLLCTWKYFIIKYLISSNMCGTAFALCTSNMCGRAIVCIRRPPSKSNIGCVRRRRIKGKTVTILIVQVRNMKKASKSFFIHTADGFWCFDDWSHSLKNIYTEFRYLLLLCDKYVVQFYLRRKLVGKFTNALSFYTCLGNN